MTQTEPGRRAGRPNGGRTARVRNLAERIGFAPSDRILIINCDDLGSSLSANTAIERALREGIGSSATLMVPCPWAESAAQSCKDLDIGIHLTLTSEYKGYRWRSLTGARSLHDKEGYLHRTIQDLWARASTDDIEGECRAQIEQALKWGIDVTHLDSHMDALLVNRHFFGIYTKLALDYQLPMRMRRSRFEAFSFISRVTLQRAGIVSPDWFVSPPWGEPSRSSLISSVHRLSNGITEIFVHPVDDGEELRSYDIENADVRAADAECMSDPAMKAMIKKAGVHLIGYKPLRNAMRLALRNPSTNVEAAHLTFFEKAMSVFRRPGGTGSMDY